MLPNNHMANAEPDMEPGPSRIQNPDCSLYVVVPCTYHRASDVQLLPDWILENDPAVPGFHTDCPPDCEP